MSKSRMPIGVEDFAEVRRGDFYYVDKTGMIKELLENWGKVNLFTRPRRFGKSMNMSMLKYFFQIGTDKSLFDGLEISKETKLCEQYMGQYPVISISLKQVTGRTYEIAEQNLWEQIMEIAADYAFMIDSDRLTSRDKKNLRDLIDGTGNLDASLKQLSGIFYRYYGKKVIILIDEYDAPLQKAHENDYYADMVALIRQIFGYALKTNDYLFFSVLTGCMRVSKESIFSDLNNPKLYTLLNDTCDERFGFTDQEVRRMLETLELSEYYETVKDWYDGYLIGRSGIYCPWDVINYCDQLMNDSDKTPRNYWANVSENGIIGKFADMADSITRDQIGYLIDGGTVKKGLDQELTYKDLYSKLDNIWSVLFTTGYLTHRKLYDDGSYDLCIPNKEVKSIFVKKINEWFSEKILDDEEGLAEFFAAFTSGDAEAMEDCLNYHLGESISYLDGGNYEDKETFYHGILIGMFRTRKGWETRSCDETIHRMVSLHAKAEREAGDGRADITAFHLRRKEAYVIEVKYTKDDKTLMADAQEAIDQINRLHYDQYFSQREPKSIRHYGIAFCQKRCKVLTEESKLSGRE